MSLGSCFGYRCYSVAGVIVSRVFRVSLFLVSATMPMAHAEAKTYRVATAASFKPILEQLLRSYPHQDQWTVVTGSSGKLASQIMSGAKFHLFLSADEQTPLKLRQQLRLPQDAVFRYGGGQLAQYLGQYPSVLACPAIAVANPRLAPYGKAAKEYLAHVLVQASEAAKVPAQPRQIVAQNVAQVAQFLATGAVPCGLLALSYRDALAKGSSKPEVNNSKTTRATAVLTAVPADSYRPFWQAGLVVVSSPGVLALRQYLLRPSSQKRIAAMGMKALPQLVQGDAAQ